MDVSRRPQNMLDETDLWTQRGVADPLAILQRRTQGMDGDPDSRFAQPTVETRRYTQEY
jgi:hypothetical protein